MVRTFDTEDPFGRRSIPGMRDAMTERRMRRVAHGRKNFYHLARNGVYDPITYYHIVDVLLNIPATDTFRTADLLKLLRDEKDMIVWDATTVGRVVTDIAESIFEKNGKKSVEWVRRWNGMLYAVDGDLESRTALVHLLEDLHHLVENLIDQERAGNFPKRTQSPLLSCPSLAV